MKPNQKLSTPSGNEVLLFPLEYMYISQGEHTGYAIDFLGWNSAGRVYNCSMYAPCSCSIVYTGNDHNAIFWSDNPVYFADGTIDYVSILVAHDETAPVLNAHFNQGDLFYHTGNYGQSTGDHVHMEIAKGHVKWNASGTGLLNPLHMYNGMFVNDTVIVRSLYNWKTYDGPLPPASIKTKKFPWVLYSKKIRERNYLT